MKTLLAAAAIALSSALAGPALSQTPEEKHALEKILSRGRLLFGLDRAAWVGTDDMLKQVTDPAGAGIRGYIVDRDTDGFTVIFFADDGDGPVAAYKGRVRGKGVASREIFAEGQRPPLTPLQRRMVAAVEAARRTDLRPCGKSPFNPLVIPPDTPDGPVEIYLMTPQTNEALPVGGHFKVTVAADGTIKDTRAFANSCLAMSARPKGAAMLVVSHLLDPLPTETHVFTSMAAGVPLAVATTRTGQVWRVSGEGIAMMARQAPRRR